MENQTITISIPISEANEILSCLKNTLKPLKDFKENLELQIKRQKITKYIPGAEVEILRRDRDRTIKECYFKYKDLGIKEMIKRTRKEVEHLPWCSWDMVYAELRQIKKALEPRKGQLWLFPNTI